MAVSHRLLRFITPITGIKTIADFYSLTKGALSPLLSVGLAEWLKATQKKYRGFVIFFLLACLP